MISLLGLFKEEDIENMKEFIGLILEGAHEKVCQYHILSLDYL